jgi:hypothetical protein
MRRAETLSPTCSAKPQQTFEAVIPDLSLKCW